MGNNSRLARRHGSLDDKRELPSPELSSATRFISCGAGTRPSGVSESTALGNWSASPASRSSRLRSLRLVRNSICSGVSTLAMSAGAIGLVLTSGNQSATAPLPAPWNCLSRSPSPLLKIARRPPRPAPASPPRRSRQVRRPHVAPARRVDWHPRCAPVRWLAPPKPLTVYSLFSLRQRYGATRVFRGALRSHLGNPSSSLPRQAPDAHSPRGALADWPDKLDRRRRGSSPVAQTAPWGRAARRLKPKRRQGPPRGSAHGASRHVDFPECGSPRPRCSSECGVRNPAELPSVSAAFGFARGRVVI